MTTSGYFITITTPKGTKEKRFVKRLGEALVILTVTKWTEAVIVPLGEKQEPEVERGSATRPVVCVETGERFNSIRECSDHFGIPYKAIWNSMEFGKPRRGLHFADANKVKKDGGDS